MRKPILAVLLITVFVALASPQTQKGTITLHEPDSPFVAFNIWVKAGSQNDPKGKEGLAALTANLLSDSSTRQDSYEQILAKLYPMAAGYESSVDKEMTVFTGRTTRTTSPHITSCSGTPSSLRRSKKKTSGASKLRP